MDDGMQEGISVREAAVILGTTERAVRFRLQRKTLAGKRVDGKWWVYLDGTEGTATGNGTVATVETVAAPDWLQPLIDRTTEQAETIGRLEERLAQTERERDALAEALHGISREAEAEEKPRGFWARLFGG